MKAKSADLNWLPPRDEWDFRSVVKSECRIACHWEYSRQIRQLSLDPEESGRTGIKDRTPYCPQRYRQAARELFPKPRMTLEKKERSRVMDSFYPIPALQVRKLGDFMARMSMGPAKDARHLQPLLEFAYVLQPNFSSHGVEAVIKEFEAWARKEAKLHRQSPRAKAAEPPFDGLKWLSALRLEDARRESGISFEQLQETLAAYRKKHPQPDPNGVYPVYASHGAWSKARADAQRVRLEAMCNSSDLLAGLD